LHTRCFKSNSSHPHRLLPTTIFDSSIDRCGRVHKSTFDMSTNRCRRVELLWDYFSVKHLINVSTIKKSEVDEANFACYLKIWRFGLFSHENKDKIQNSCTCWKRKMQNLNFYFSCWLWFFMKLKGIISIQKQNLQNYKNKRKFLAKCFGLFRMRDCNFA